MQCFMGGWFAQFIDNNHGLRTDTTRVAASAFQGDSPVVESNYPS